MTRARRTFRRRCGFTYLEMEVSFLLFAVALSGLAPLAVMHSRQVRTTETLFDADDTHYFCPSSNPWARKLGAAASLSVDPPLPTIETVLLIDDGDQGYLEETKGAYDWYDASPAGAFGGDVRLNSHFDHGDKMFWEFDNLRLGSYEVLVTFQPYAFATYEARYRVYREGDKKQLEERIDQRIAPAGPVYSGVPWVSLGTVTVQKSEPDKDGVLVELDDDDHGFLVADAARLVWRGNLVQVDSFHKSTDTEPVSAVVTVTAPAP
jgi:hypothetical protein